MHRPIQRRMKQIKEQEEKLNPGALFFARQTPVQPRDLFFERCIRNRTAYAQTTSVQVTSKTVNGARKQARQLKLATSLSRRSPRGLL